MSYQTYEFLSFVGWSNFLFDESHLGGKDDLPSSAITIIHQQRSFVAGIERDYDAVKAGLSLHWSQGAVEGSVNKLKMHKRLMYGRAGFRLLRQKLLHQT